MTEKNDAHHGDRSTGHERSRLDPFRDPPASAEALTEQQKLLERLRSCQDEARRLREREVELEVERMQAEIFLRSSSKQARFNLDPRAANKIAEAFHRKQTLARALGIGKPAPTGAKAVGFDDPERLRIGRAALISWLEAPRAVRSQRVPRVVYAVILVVAVAVVWASVTIHPAFLLILVGLAPAIALLRMPGQDLIWVRLGAQRKFKATALKPPASWRETAVQDRVGELDRKIDEQSRQTSGAADAAEIDEDELELERREIEFAQANAHLEALLGEAGLDAEIIDEEFGQWLELVGKTRSLRKALEQLKTKRTQVDAEIDRGRETIFRFLSRQGEAPSNGNADLDVLAEGIKRLRHR